MNESRLFELIEKEANHDLSPDEEAELKRWERRSGGNAKQVAQLRAIFERSEPVVPHLERDEVDRAWQGVAVRTGIDQERGLRGPSRRFVWPLAAAAGIVGLALGIVTLLTPGGKMETAEAARGETRTITFVDGSTVRLNADTRIRYHVRGNGKREVILDGEAYFNVARDESRPFVVRTDHASVEVLGTQFNVWSRGTSRVAVKSGRVAVWNPEETRESARELLPDTRIDCTDGGCDDAPSPIDFGATLGWINGRIVFQDATLADAITELERIYDAHIEVRGEGIAGRTISGTFEKKAVSTILDQVCVSLDLTLTIDSSRFIISP